MKSTRTVTVSGNSSFDFLPTPANSLTCCSVLKGVGSHTWIGAYPSHANPHSDSGFLFQGSDDNRFILTTFLGFLLHTLVQPFDPHSLQTLPFLKMWRQLIVRCFVFRARTAVTCVISFWRYEVLFPISQSCMSPYTAPISLKLVLELMKCSFRTQSHVSVQRFHLSETRLGAHKLLLNVCRSMWTALSRLQVMHESIQCSHVSETRYGARELLLHVCESL